MLENIMHSCQLSLISKDSPEVQYNLVNCDPDNRNVLLNDSIISLQLRGGGVHNAHHEWT